MVSVSEFGPLFFLGASAISLYLFYKLSRIIRQPETTMQKQPDPYRKSLTAQALYELSGPTPNFSPLLMMMCEDVKRVGGGLTQAGKTFIAECERLSPRGVTEASTFNRLYHGYLEAIRQSEGKEI